jgi:septal ring factor EnvC (AmiA/AmiB activator)
LERSGIKLEGTRWRRSGPYDSFQGVSGEKQDSGTSFRIIFCLVFIFVSILPAHFARLSAADPKKELEQVQKKLLQEKQKVKQTIKREKSTLSELERLNKILGKKQKELTDYDNRLSRTRSKIRQLENDILLMNGKIDKRASFLRERFKSIYKQRHGSIADMLVSAKDNQDLMKRIKYISLIAEYDRRLMSMYMREVKALNNTMETLDLMQKELEMNKRNVQKKTAELQENRRNKDKLLVSIKSERSSYEKMVKELEASSKSLREMIEKLRREKDTVPVKGKGFSQLRGRLPWPVYGKVLLPYGKHRDPKFNVTTYRKGIEISADLGSAVLSIAEGKVVFADSFKGYGQLVIVNHGGGYHTLYGNLSEIFHTTGDIIRRRQAVGKVGESGVLSESSLYFEIRYKGKPLNPTYWLRSAKK